jgi:peptidoglycan hydrolase-like protein with peptidoglycan-binding domain
MIPLRTATVAVVVAFAAPALGTDAADARPLQRGAKGPRVERLQRALHLAPDGVFGPGTARALRRFQRRHDLHADGIAGAATWRMIRRARSAGTAGGGARSAARVQHRGPSVRLLQRRLGIAADGVFGAGTARAVRRLQRRHGLTADGIAGPATWRALGVAGRHPVLRRAGGTRGGASRPGASAVVARAIAAANRIAGLPYVYGGGHASFAARGYDCSGSVSYVLHAIGRLGRPRDSGQLTSYGAPGRGRYITVYANAGHAYMVIGGRRFDTSARSETGSRWTGTARSASAYVARHPPGL